VIFLNNEKQDEKVVGFYYYLSVIISGIYLCPATGMVA
jgi:hypothetical protein